MNANSSRTSALHELRQDEGLPGWFFWALPPLAAPLAAMAWLRAHWDAIPARYVAHHGSGNWPGGWATRTPLHVMGPLIFGLGLTALMLMVALVTHYGTRKTSSRASMTGVFLTVMYLIGFVFTAVGLDPLVKIPLGPVGVVVPLVSIGLLVYVYRKNSEPDDQPDETPAECWSLAGIYNNPRDPALFVAKREGFGSTLNFGNPWAKWFMIGLLGGIAALSAFLFWAER
jgi:uncharacterized membrane protein